MRGVLERGARQYRRSTASAERGHNEAGGPRSSYSAIRPSGRALVAAPLDSDLDFAPPIPGGKWNRRQPRLVEANELAAGAALEVGLTTGARGPAAGG